MAEIKSTLDLVMEKTRHLTLSREEKTAQTLRSVRDSIAGWLQKFDDRHLDATALTRELDRLQVPGDSRIADLTAAVILERLDLERPDRQRLGLLQDYCGRDVTALENCLQAFSEALRNAADEHGAALLGDLARERGIEGTAVVPHLEIDAAWQATVAQLREAFTATLNAEKKRLSSPGAA